MKPILDVRQQTSLGSFEPEWQLLLQSPEARSESTSHLFQMVRGERRREGEKRSIRQLEAGFPLQWQQYFYLCGCICVHRCVVATCIWMVKGGGKKILVSNTKDKIWCKGKPDKQNASSQPFQDCFTLFYLQLLSVERLDWVTFVKWVKMFFMTHI